MSISNSKQSIDQAISKALEEAKELELEQRADRLKERIEAKYMINPLGNRWPCVALMWDLTGADAHMASDEVEEMKSTVTDLLVLLTDPEIAQKFEKIRDFQSRHFATHLKRIMKVLEQADVKEIYAEMAHYELSAFGFDEQKLDRLEGDFENL